MQDEYDKWNEIKKSLENEDSHLFGYPKEREVWMTALGKNLGFEQNGSGENFSRPVLVVKKFNNQMFWVVPLSTKQKDFDFYFNYKDVNSKNVSAILAQIKLLSVKRFKRKMYDLPQEVFESLKIKIKSFF